MAAIAQCALIQIGCQHARIRAADVQHHDHVVLLLAHALTVLPSRPKRCGRLKAVLRCSSKLRGGLVLASCCEASFDAWLWPWRLGGELHAAWRPVPRHSFPWLVPLSWWASLTRWAALACALAALLP